jgi:hypothetical protein
MVASESTFHLELLTMFYVTVQSLISSDQYFVEYARFRGASCQHAGFGEKSRWTKYDADRITVFLRGNGYTVTVTPAS